MKKSIILVAIFSFIFSSCTKDVINEINTDEISSNPKLEANSISFTYKGSLYETTYVVSEDSTIIWDNKKIGNLYQQLFDMPELATLVKDNGSIEFFDNYNEIPAKHTDTNEFRSAWAPISVYLYVDINFSKLGYSLENASRASAQIPSFSDLADKNGGNMNDKLSSFHVECGGSNGGFSVTLFENKNYGGKSLTFIIPPLVYGFRLQNLKNYSLSSGFLGIGAKSWNDQVSSMKVL